MKILEKHLARLATQFEVAAPPPKPKFASDKLKKQYAAHFDNLFHGLSLAPVTPNPHNTAQIGVCSSDEAVSKFKGAYYNGAITPKFARAALDNPNLDVSSVALLLRLIDEGGTLVKWTPGERLFFELRAASRLWRGGQAQLASRIIAESYAQATPWIEGSLHKTQSREIRVLAQAVRLNPELSSDLLSRANSVKVVWVLWAEFRGDVRDQAFAKLAGLLNRPLAAALEQNAANPAVIRANPSTEYQVAQLLERLGLWVPVVPMSSNIHSLD